MKINSSIVFNASGFLVKLITLISILLLLQGHNTPGGGFIGGLTFICAYILIKINVHESYVIENVYVRQWILGLGLLLIALSVFYPTLFSAMPLTGVWYKLSLWGHLFTIGTPLIFDIGVYLIISMSISFIVDDLEKTWR